MARNNATTKPSVSHSEQCRVYAAEDRLVGQTLSEQTNQRDNTQLVAETPTRDRSFHGPVMDQPHGWSLVASKRNEMSHAGRKPVRSRGQNDEEIPFGGNER